MSDEEKMRKFAKMVKAKDGSSNPMARLGRLGSGPDVKLAISSTGPSTSCMNGAAGASSTAQSSGPSTPSSSLAAASVAAATKKTFSPNLMSKARKEAPAKEEKSGGGGRERRKFEPRMDRGRGRGRGRGGGGARGGFQNSNIVQSSSIFEDGVADVQKKTGSGAPSYGGGGGGGDSIRESISISSKISQADPQKTQEMLKKLFSDDFVTRPDLQSAIPPVSLPLYVEPNEDDDEGKESDKTATSKSATHKRKATVLDVLNPAEMERPKDPRMIFIQLPDSLPFDSTPDSTTTKREVKQESLPPTTSTSTATASSSNGARDESVTERDPDVDELMDDSTIFSRPHADNPNATTLQKLPEGQIGKVRVRASGKCELVFPNGHVFDLSLGTPSGFHQEFVSVSLDEQKKKGDMTSLGTVKHKIIAIPNFETLLKKLDRDAAVTRLALI